MFRGLALWRGICDFIEVCSTFEGKEMYVFVAPEYLPIICLACCIGGKISEIEGRFASINGLGHIQVNENSSQVSPRV